MLDDCPVGYRQSTVYRLAATYLESLDAVLLKRGIDPASIAETRMEIARVGGQFTPEEIVSNSFRGRTGRSKPFSETRFSDGMIGVYYSALEVSTCEKEIVFHLEIKEGDDTRYFSLIDCELSGTTADLRGKENDYPNLVSQTEAGYPFCQRLGKKATQKNIDAFYTASARNEGRACVPVFTETALSNPSITGRVKVTATSDGVRFDEI